MQYVIHSPQSPIECYMSLDIVTDPNSLLVRHTGNGRFYGEVTKERFSVRPHSTIIKGMPPPLINGQFKPTDNGTDIIIDIEGITGSPMPLILAGGFLLLGGGINSVHALINEGWESALMKMLTAAAVGAFCLVFLYFGHVRPKRKAMRVFNEIFE